MFLRITYYKCCITIEFVISGGIDLAKSKNSKECMTCRYWFFTHGFKFQDSVWNGCHKGPFESIETFCT